MQTAAIASAEAASWLSWWVHFSNKRTIGIILFFFANAIEIIQPLGRNQHEWSLDKIVGGDGYLVFPLVRMKHLVRAGAATAKRGRQESRCQQETGIA